MQVSKILLTLAVLLASLNCLQAQDDAETQDDAQTTPPRSLEEKASYLLGRGIIDDFRAQQINVDLEQLILGIRAAAVGEANLLSDEDARSVMEVFGREVEKRQQAQLRQAADQNMRASSDFLRQHALQADVIQLESGVQYRVLAAGSGAKPTLADRVKLHLTGKTVSGTQFESTIESQQPLEIPVGGIAIRGLMETLLRMNTGSKWEIVVPPELGYGVSGAPPEIGPNEVLIFEIELISIQQDQ